MRDIEEYISLVPPLNRNKPDFDAVLRLVLQPFVDNQNFIASIPQAFDLDSAVGAQLDVDGEWLNRSRKVPIPLPDPWFSFDDPLRGVDFAPWLVPGVGAGTTYVSLDDDTYRRLLYATRAANLWDGTTPGAVAAFQQFFVDPATYIFVEDKCDMSMTIGVAGKIPTIVDLQVLAQRLIRLKPQTVAQDVVVTSVSNTPIFGFDVVNSLVSGFDTGSIGVTPDYASQHLA